MTPHEPRADRFCYDGFTINAGTGEVRCSYSTGGHTFTETYQFDPDGDWDSPAAHAAIRILFLLAGVSYYKTTAAPVIDLGALGTTAGERRFLTDFYRNGLAEFAYRNGIELHALAVVGPDIPHLTSAGYVPIADRPLIPFGGGIDSIVTVAALQIAHPQAALCIVHPPANRFPAIESAASVTKLPVTRVIREIDPLVRRSAELGFLNGHVPITAVISAAALVAAVLDHRDAVVLSNEWSASAPTLVDGGRAVNHQWSKGDEFEQSFATLVVDALGPNIAVFSYLRSRSELWVAEQFARLNEFHGAFRSCNRSFHQNAAQRLDHWCGACDKCCFIDLILAPYMSAVDLGTVFAGHEPLENPELQSQFETLLGLEPDAKPFECVGDTDECRTALRLAAARPDRRDTQMLVRLLARVTRAEGPDMSLDADPHAPMGPHYIPDRYVPSDLLVRAD